MALTCCILRDGSAESTGAGLLPCQYDVVTIPPPDLPGIGDNVKLYDVNDSGLGVGAYGVSIVHLACRWTAKEGVSILASPPGVSDVTAWKVNNNGWILVTGWAAGQQRSFVYVPSEAGYDIVHIPPAVSWGAVSVNGLNDKNEVVGGLELEARDGSGVWAGFRWTLAGGLELFQVPGWTATVCNDINNSGIIVGNVGPTSGADSASPGVRAFVANVEGVTVFEPPAPWIRAWSVAINESGDIAGAVHQPADGTEPTKWAGWIADVTLTDPLIIPPPAGWPRWSVRDMNESGVMCGSVKSSASAGTPKPCVATAMGVVMLNDLVPGTSQPGVEAWAITAEGKIFTQDGYGVLMLVPQPSTPDLNCDGAVDAEDLAFLLTGWGTSSAVVDITGDGVVDGADVGALLAAWSG